jgi:UTP--glucose-1-phosphate uridylyltransferase
MQKRRGDPVSFYWIFRRPRDASGTFSIERNSTGLKEGMGKVIETAVIPAAGFGKRMGRLTTLIPKELLPLGRIPMIEHTITELQCSGIKRICVVIRKGKEVIEEYLKKQRYKGIEINFVFQIKPLGSGDALRNAKDFVGGAPFVMALPDQILLSDKPATGQLLEQTEKAKGIWNSMVRIPKKELCFFEGARTFQYQKAAGNMHILKGFSRNKSSIRGFGRTVFLPEALDYMTEEFMNRRSGEVDLFKTYRGLKKRFPLYGVLLEGKPCDVGTWGGYYFYQKILQSLCLKEKIV